MTLLDIERQFIESASDQQLEALETQYRQAHRDGVIGERKTQTVLRAIAHERRQREFSFESDR